MFSDLPGSLKKFMLTSSENNKVNSSRKRQSTSGVKNDHRNNDLVETPVKQRRLAGNRIQENEDLTLSRRLSKWLSWMVDVPLRNYFVQSVVTAIRSPLSGRSNDVVEPLENLAPQSAMKESSVKGKQNPIAENNATPEWKKKRNLARSPLRGHNPFVPTHSFNEQKINGEKPLYHGRPEAKSSSDTNSKNKNVTPQQNNIQKNALSHRRVQETKGGIPKASTSSGASTLLAISKQDSFNKNKTRNPSLQSRRKWPPISTAEQSIRLQEKEQYRKLLQQFTSEPLFQPVPKTSILMKDAGVQNDMPCAFDPLAMPSTSHQVSFLEKQEGSSTFSKPVLYEKKMPEMLKKAKLNKTKAQVFNNTMKDSSSDDSGENAFITKIEPPKHRYKTVASHLRDSPFFSNKWLEDLKASIASEVAERHQKIREQEKRTKELQLKRESHYSDLEEQINERMKQKCAAVLSDTMGFDEDDIVESLIELTPEMEAKVEDALRPNPPDEVLVEGFKLSVTRRDMETLAGLNWLNDEIINFYMNMLMERGKLDNFPSVYAFNTFFYLKLISAGHGALKRWTRKIDIFSYDLILVPVHMGMHWCLAVIDFRYRKIQYYDSMGGQNNECLNALRCYLQEECLDKKKQEYDMSGWALETVKNIPQQMNGSDCGMFALKYAEYITRDARINFAQAHMPYFRRRMVYEILSKQLL